MPKARVEKVLSDDGTNKHIQVEVGERGVTKTAEYVVPSDPMKFQEMVLGLKDTPDATFERDVLKDEGREDKKESPLAFVYRMYVTAVDRTARAAVYESIAADSTTITVGKTKIDIKTFPPAKLVKAINEYESQVKLRADALASAMSADEALEAAEKSIGFGPWKTAKRKLVEEKKATEAQDGTLSLVG
jgi:hypothetical protein